MDNSDSIWGSLVANLEDECDQVFNRDTSRTPSNSRDNGLSTNVSAPATQASWPGINMNSTVMDMNFNTNSRGMYNNITGMNTKGTPRSDDWLLARPFASFPSPNQRDYERKANLALHAHMEAVQDNVAAGTAISSTSAATSSAAVPTMLASPPVVASPTILPFKQWIKHAIHSAGGKASSPAYLGTALKIAISLTDQLIQADKLARYGISEKLDLLSTQSGHKWAEYVVIRLKSTSLSQSGGRGSNVDVWLQPPAINEHQDMNEQMEIFLEFFERRTRQQMMARGGSSSGYQGSTSLDDNNMSVSKAGSVIDNSARSESNDDCNYLDVDIAEIRCPENSTGGKKTSGEEGRDNTEIQRMYYLGLVLYELFSGGSVPPPELYALAASDGAFVSLPTLTLVKSGDEDDDIGSSRPSESKRHHGPSGKEMGLCRLSFQYLKLMDLPGPICHLIFNMLDCIYGDLGGDECYVKLTDVMFDLQLMRDKPEKFMRDLDMDKLSLSGLQLDENAIPREAELECIKGCYRRRVLGSSELALIKGESGTGKSWLAQKVGKFITNEGGVFLMGKFDQMKHMKPFSALASAFDQYCDYLSKEKETSWAKGVVYQLNAALGQDACHLIQLIPKLSLVLDNYTPLADFNLDQNCVHTKQRLHYMLTQFVEAISMNSYVSVTLFMDDVQWADEASISVLDLLLRRQHKNIFFMWSCRDDEMEVDHPIWHLIHNIRSIGIHATVVVLKCMEAEELNTTMSDLLCLSPRIVRPLSNLMHKKTKGNVLFFSQLLLSLNRNGLVRLNYDLQRWVWDEEKIYSMKLPDNVALCFANGIKKLPFEVQSALKTLSMFGTTTKISYLTELEKKLSLNVTAFLKTAAADGLVSYMKGVVQFNHDRIQEVVYSMIDEQVRLHFHLIYGDCLVKLSEEVGGDADMMFMGVHQINLGGPSAVADPGDLVTMVRYNLTAGKRAMEMSGFALAFSFFGCGIQFLPSNYWSEHYHLSLELFELASKAALVSGNDRRFGLMSDEVLNHATCFEDKLNINYIIMGSLVSTPKIAEALEMGRAILSRLGEVIPGDSSSENLDEHIKSTQALIKGMNEDDLLNYRMMTDDIQLMKMKFLAKTESIAILIRPDLHPFITLKMVQLTISHGLSPTAPIVFVCFGSLLAKAGNLQVGYKFALLSKRLLDKLNVTEIKGEVLTAVTELQCFVEPILATNDLRAQAEHAAILAGDVYFGCISRLHYCLVLLWSGLNLNSVNESMAKACQYMKDQGEDTSLLITMIAHRTVSTLAGTAIEAPTETELARIIEGNGSRPRQLIIFSFNNLYLAYMLNGNVGAVKKFAQKFLEREKSTYYILFSDTIHAFILGLAAFQICRESEAHEASQWLKIGRKCTIDMQLWAEQGCVWNFQHKYLLLKAEEFFSRGNLAAAKEAYISAIAYARKHRIINDEALACELTGKFLLNVGDLQSSLDYFRMAHEKYEHWGSPKKADLLFQFISAKFSGVLSRQIYTNSAGASADAVSRKRGDL